MRKKQKILILISMCLLTLTACTGGKYKEYCEMGASAVDAQKWQEAIDAYSQAIELDNKRFEAYQGRAAAAKGMAEATNDAVDKAAAYHNAAADYRTVLSMTDCDAGVYLSAAEVSEYFHDLEEAHSILQQGTDATNDPAIQSALDRVETKIKLSKILTDIPYYGYRDRCTMTGEQAAAYAGLLQDGLDGKITLETVDGDITAPWDQPFSVPGAYSYETSRSAVILADFANDGNPYLFVFNPEYQDRSYTIYGWHDGLIEQVENTELVGYMIDNLLIENTKFPGLVIEKSESSHMLMGDSRVYIFSNGMKILGYSMDYEGQYRNGEQRMIVTENGTTYDYSWTEYEHWLEDYYAKFSDGSYRGHSLEEVCKDSLSLSRMREQLTLYSSTCQAIQHQ